MRPIRLRGFSARLHISGVKLPQISSPGLYLSWLKRTPDKREVMCSSRIRPTRVNPRGDIAQLGERRLCKA